MVEKGTGRKLKVLRSDNGGEYTSTQFQDYLKSEGVIHERRLHNKMVLQNDQIEHSSKWYELC